MPDSVKNRLGYIKVSSVEGTLTRYCVKDCCPRVNLFNSQQENNNNPNNNNNGNPFDAGRAMNERVEVLGGGVAIGSSSVQRPN